MVMQYNLEILQKDFEELIDSLDEDTKSNKLKVKAFFPKIGITIQKSVEIMMNDYSITRKSIETLTHLINEISKDFDVKADKYVVKKSKIWIPIVIMYSCLALYIWQDNVSKLKTLNTTVSKYVIKNEKFIGGQEEINKKSEQTDTYILEELKLIKKGHNVYVRDQLEEVN